MSPIGWVLALVYLAMTSNWPGHNQIEIIDQNSPHHCYGDLSALNPTISARDDTQVMTQAGCKNVAGIEKGDVDRR